MHFFFSIESVEYHVLLVLSIDYINNYDYLFCKDFSIFLLLFQINVVSQYL